MLLWIQLLICFFVFLFSITYVASLYGDTNLTGQVRCLHRAQTIPKDTTSVRSPCCLLKHRRVHCRTTRLQSCCFLQAVPEHILHTAPEILFFFNFYLSVYHLIIHLSFFSIYFTTNMNSCGSSSIIIMI